MYMRRGQEGHFIGWMGDLTAPGLCPQERLGDRLGAIRRFVERTRVAREQDDDGLAMDVRR